MGNRKILGPILYLVLSAVLLTGLFTLNQIRAGRMTRSHVSCAIQKRPMSDTTRALLTGYNYHLLERFADDNGITLDIRLVDKSDNALDSLIKGSLDILSVPFEELPDIDSVQTTIPVDSMSLWLVSSHDVNLLKSLNKWIADYHVSAEYDSTRALFMTPSCETHLSPYDGIFKSYADTLGWDWRLLAAVAYQESYFRIEVGSRRGAKGIMQIMPHTARYYDVDNVIDPRENIRAGCWYLKALYKRYRRISDQKQRKKFTIAAYNAGEGRIRDIRGYARHRNVNTDCWESVKTVIPDMNRKSVYDSDSVRLGRFDGTETIRYVDKVFATYDYFCRICPED